MSSTKWIAAAVTAAAVALAAVVLVQRQRTAEAELQRVQQQEEDSVRQVLDSLEEMIVGVMKKESAVPSIPPFDVVEGEYHISSPFGPRVDPVYGDVRFHKGQDIGMERGKPVYASGDATVERADYNMNGYGNEVLLDHGYGYKTRYAHLDSILVKVGESVKRGERIGTVGSTGKSTGPHLHYEVYYLGRAVNPMKYIDLKDKQ